MVTLKLFGLLQEESRLKSLTLSAGTVKEALAEAARQGIPPKLLARAVVFVNGVPLHGRARHSTRLRDGDEVALLSPASGG